MGIIKATAIAIRGATADQWKEAFYAGEMGSNLLMARAKKLSGQNSANEGSGEVIMDGSTIIVGKGECTVAAIRSGDDIKTVQGNLGHATASFTLDVYGHVTDQMKNDSAARMEAYIKDILSA